MDIVLRRTGISIQPKRAEVISKDDIEAGLAAGTLKKVDSYIYEECDPPPTPVDPDPEPEVDPDTGTTTETYSTKVLTAAKSTAKKRSAKK